MKRRVSRRIPSSDKKKCGRKPLSYYKDDPEEYARQKAIYDEQTARIAKYRFKPGESGNYNGRPRTPEEVKTKLREAAEPIIDELIRKALDPNDPKQQQALEYLADRIYGKATQPLDIESQNEVKVTMAAEIKELSE